MLETLENLKLLRYNKLKVVFPLEILCQVKILSVQTISRKD